jgi:hypothetical protein
VKTVLRLTALDQLRLHPAWDGNLTPILLGHLTHKLWRFDDPATGAITITCDTCSPEAVG